MNLGVDRSVGREAAHGRLECSPMPANAVKPRRRPPPAGRRARGGDSANEPASTR
jgi:hypothetical protein